MAKQFMNNTFDPNLEPAIDQTPNLVPEFIMDDNLTDFDSMSPVQLDRYIEQVNTARAGYPSDYNSARSSQPALQVANYDLRNPDHFKQLMNNPRILNPDFKKNVELKDPRMLNVYDANYDRYYNHPKFDELGFNPMFNMEEYYNENSTAWDDWGRTWRATMGTIKAGYLSAPRSVADLFQGDDYFDTPDFKSAAEFAQSTRIAQSTRGGFTGFANNTFNQLGYSIGMVGEILTEELIILGASAAMSSTVVGAPAGVATAVGGTFRNILRLGRVGEYFARAATKGRAAYSYLKNLKQMDVARDFWNTTKAGGRWVGDRLTPNTIKAFNKTKTAQRAGEKISNLALASRTFGGFYRDLRALNFAVSEGKLEAGMRYNDTVNELAELQLEINNGDPLTPEQLSTIHDHALGAAVKTLHWNIPAIYLTNQLVFGKALAGFNPKIAKIFSPTNMAFKGELGKTAVKNAEGKVIKELVEDVVETKAKEAFKLKNLRIPKRGELWSSAKGATHASLRFFAANLGEGTQELYQEAISAGFGEYYKDLYKDPAMAEASSIFMDLTYAAKGTKAEGFSFETFASGFAIGGIMGFGSRVAMEWVPTQYSKIQRGVNEEKRKEYEEAKAKWKASVNDASVALLSDKFASQDILTDKHLENMAVQNESNREMRAHEYVGDEAGLADARDNALFTHLHTLLQTGSKDLFIEKLQDIKGLDDATLIEYLQSAGFDQSEAKSFVESGTYRNNIDKTIKDLYSLESKMEAINSKYRNPIDLRKYKENTPEYANALRNYNIWEHAKRLYLYTSDGFDKARERAAELDTKLRESKVLNKVASNDISAVIDQRLLDTEINLLKSEIRTLEQTEGEEIKQQLKDKTKKLELLEKYRDVLNKEENNTKKGTVRRNRTVRKQVATALSNYFNHVGSTSNDFVNKEELELFVDRLLSRFELDGRSAQYYKTLEFLDNPKNFVELYERVANMNISNWMYGADAYKQMQDERLKRRERGMLMADFASLQVYPDPDQAKVFLETGDPDVLVKFVSATGSTITDNALNAKIRELINSWKTDQLVNEELAKEAEARAQESAVEELEKNLDEINKEYVLNGKVARQVLEKRYRLDNNSQEGYISFDEWLQTKVGKNILVGIADIKSLWLESLEEISGDVVESDRGFLPWLSNNINTPGVQAVFNETGLVKEDFDLSGTIEGNRDDFVKSGPGINIQRVESVDSDGNLIVNFRITDNYGKALSNQKMTDGQINWFDTEAQAKRQFDSLLPVYKDQPYKFGKNEIRFKDVVEDSQGQRFIFYGTSDESGKGGLVLLLPVEKKALRNRNDIREQAYKKPAKQFGQQLGGNGYTIVKEEPSVSYDKLAKLYPSEFTGSIPMKRGDEDWTEATRTFRTILSFLTPEDLKSATIIVAKTSEQGLSSDLSIPGYESNPFIKAKSNKYDVAIKLSATTIKDLGNRGLSPEIVNKLLQLQPIGSQAVNGVIGFIRNGVYDLGEANPYKLSDAELAKKYLRYDDKTVGTLEREADKFRSGYSQQLYLLNALDKLKLDPETGTAQISYEELSKKLGVNFILSPGQFLEAKEKTKKLTEVGPYNTYEGVGVIIKAYYQTNDQGQVKVYADYIFDEEEANKKNIDIVKLEEKLRGEIESLNKSNNVNMLQELVFRRGAFNGIIKPENGQPSDIVFAELQPEVLPKEELTTIFEGILQRAKETAENNIDVSKDESGKDIVSPINNTFNDSYNEELKSQYYIASIPGSYVTIDVSPTGIIRLDYYYDSKKGKGDPVKVSYPIYPEKQAAYREDPASLMNAFKTLASKASAADGIKQTISFTENSFRRGNESQDFKNLVDNTRTGLSFDGGRSDIRFIVSSDKEAAMMNTLNEHIKKVSISNEQAKEIALKASKKPNNGKSSLSKEEQELLDNNTEEVSAEINSMGLEDPFNANLGSQESAEEVDASKQALDAAKAELKELQQQERDLINEANKAEKPKEARRAIRGQLTELANKQQEVIKKIEALTRGVDKSGINLLPSQALAVDVFTQWAASNLPDFIQLDDIRNLGIKLKNEGVDVGKFSMYLHMLDGKTQIGGTIFTGASSTVLYHEAFHAVYRLLLTPEQQAKLLKIAKSQVRKQLKADGLSLSKELNKLRQKYPKYEGLTDLELEKIYYEEWMADQFERFKVDPRSSNADSTIKSWFNKLKEWIKAIVKRFTRNELESVFDQIDSGKFKDAPIQSNEFTRHLQEGVTIDAYKNITKEYINAPEFLDPIAARDIIKLITASYISEAEAADEYVVEDILDDVIYDYQRLYDPSNEVYADYSDTLKKQLSDVHKALMYQNGAEVKEGVKTYINSYIAKIDKLKDVLDDLESSLGGRTTDQFDLDASNIGGHSALPFKIRVFIATQTVQNVDAYGNPKYENGESLRVPVAFEDVFYAFTKSMSNKNTAIDMVRSAYYFSKRNNQSRVVLENIFKTSNLDLDAAVNDGKFVALNPDAGINSQFFHQFIKSFRNEKRDYYVIHRDGSQAIQYSAAIRDAASNQIISWRNNWFKIFKNFSGESDNIKAAVTTLNQAQKDLQSGKLDSVFDIIRYLKDSTGIELSPQYVEFSILAHKATKQELKGEEKTFYDLYKDEVTPLSPEAVGVFKTLIDAKTMSGSNLVRNPSNIYADQKSDEDAMTRIKTLANNNALLDETVGVTVFLNAENKLVYVHQMPTYHLSEVRNLNSTEYLDNKVKNSNGFLTENYLYKNPLFQELQNQNKLKVISIDGVRYGSLNNAIDVSELNIAQRNQEGIKYGALTFDAFAANSFEFYLNAYNTKNGSVQTIETSDKQKAALAPINIRVMETANMGDWVLMPVIRTIEKRNGKIALTQETVDFFFNDIQNEWNRIRREMQRHFPDGVIVDNVDYDKLNIDRITGYNTIDKKGQIVGISEEVRPRAFRFFKYESLINNSQILEGLQDAALNQESFIDAIKSIGYTPAQFKASISRAVLNDVQDYIDNVIDIDQISDNLKGKIVNTSGSNLLNLTDDVDYNIHQIYLNEWINTSSLNDLLLGDHARLFKDASIEPTKRGKGQNGSIVNVEGYLEDKELGIKPLGDKSIQAFIVTDKVLQSSLDDSNIDSTDAQIWGTVNGLAHFLHGLGEITPSMRTLIKKTKANEKITVKEWEKFVKDKAIFNSEKFVYFDGETYLKMSFVPLIPELTTDPNTGTAIQGREALHNMRVSLEASEKEGKVSLAVPQTAAKQLQMNVTTFEDLVSSESSLEQAKPMLLNARHFGRQMVVPSNKTEITSLSQIKTLITSEHSEQEQVVINGETIKIGNLLDRYQSLAAAGVNFNYTNRRNLLFDLLPYASDIEDLRGDITNPNLFSFLKYAQESLKRAHATSTNLELFSLRKEFETQFQKYELNNPISIDMFERLFMSFFSSGVVKEKVNGHTHALVSFEMLLPRLVYSVTDGKIDRQKLIRQTQFDNNLKVPQILRMDNYKTDAEFVAAIQEELEKGNGPVMVLDRLRSNLKEYTDPKDSKTYTKQYYSETMYASHYKEVTEKIANTEQDIPDVIAKNQSVRVPSQDKHSAMNAKLVDFLPLQYGSTASFAKEIVQITGADFDIDKVYMTIKDWYINEKGEFVEYGASSRFIPGKKNNPDYKQGYIDYVNYVNKTVFKPGSYLAEAYAKHLNNNAVVDPTYDNDIQFEASQALSILNLPTNFDSYVTYREDKKIEPYPAAMNNELLDIKFGLLGNEGMSKAQASLSTPIAYTPLTMDPIEDAYRYLKNEIPYIMDAREISNIDINNPKGKAKVWKNVKEASGSIGTVVVPNLVANALTASQIKTSEITFLGNKYDSFGETFVKGSNETQRAQTTVDSLVSAVVDDAKYNFLARLGLDRPALRVATYMSSLGVPLNDTLLLLNHPEVDLGTVKGKLKGLIALELPPIKVSREDLINSINNFSDPDATLEGFLNQYISLKSKIKKDDSLQGAFEIAEKRLQVLKEILNTFNHFSNITSTAQKVIPFFNLISEGHSSFADILDREDAIKELGLDIKDNKTWRVHAKKNKIYLDLRPLFKNGMFLKTYMDIHKDFANNVLPNIFITYNKTFNDFYAILNKSFSLSQQDLLSYLIAKAHLNRVANSNSSLDGNAVSLTNEFLYDTGGNSNIAATFENLLEQDSNKENYFLQNYLNSQKATDLGNNTKLNIVKSNTFGKIGEAEKLKIQEGFQRLIADPATYRQAMDFVNHILVKDGLQFKEGSLLDAINIPAIERILNSASDVMSAMRGEKSFEQVFGSSYDGMKKEFLVNYGKSAGVSRISSAVGRIVNETENELLVENNADEEREFSLYKFYGGKVYMLPDNLIDGVLETGSLTVPSKETVLYTTIETEGSPSQNPIGFVFGPRPLTKNLVSVEQTVVAKEKAPSKVQQAINENRDIVATENSVEVSESKDALEDPFGAKPEDFDFGQAAPQRVESTNENTSGTIKRNYVDLENPITSFEPEVQALFNSPTPTIEAYETAIANYEFDLSADISDSLRKDIESKLRDVTNSFTIVQASPQSVKQTQQTSNLEVVSRYSNADVKANPNKIYVFGDNTQRTGTGGQAQIRNNPNAMGIATKLAPSNAASAFMTDKDLNKNKAVIDGDIAKIKATGKDVVFPKDGLGTGLAKLKEKAPKTYAYLKQRLLEEFGFDNDTGTIVQAASQSVEQTFDDPFSAVGINPNAEAVQNIIDDFTDKNGQISLSFESATDDVSLKLLDFHTQELFAKADRLNAIRNNQGLDVDTAEKLINAYKALKLTQPNYTVNEFIDKIKNCY